MNRMAWDSYCEAEPAKPCTNTIGSATSAGSLSAPPAVMPPPAVPPPAAEVPAVLPAVPVPAMAPVTGMPKVSESRQAAKQTSETATITAVLDNIIQIFLVGDKVLHHRASTSCDCCEAERW